MSTSPNGILDASEKFSLLHNWTEFYLALTVALKEFPKRDRHSLGRRLDDNALEMLDMLILASRRRGAARLRALDKLDRELVVANILLRLANRTRALKDSRYISLEKRVVVMGKMVGGWTKFEKQATRGA